jgi:aminoglycoside phosphotransferase (APT) family kinase protein
VRRGAGGDPRHALDGLPPLETSDAASELARYEAVYRQSGARRPVFEAAFRWLAAARRRWSGRCWSTATFATAT